jgi:hypothetical protein
MTIEKRQSKRIPFHNAVQIRYRDQRAFSGESVNLSQDGMLLRSRTLQINKGTMIDLEFHFAGRQWHIPALVVHAGSNGLGVLFSIRQKELYQIAREIERSQPSMTPCRTGEQRISRA